VLHEDLFHQDALYYPSAATRIVPGADGPPEIRADGAIGSLKDAIELELHGV
jgi:hypothetical protein